MESEVVKVEPRLFESLMKEQWFEEEVKKLEERASGNRFFKKFLELGVKEGLLSDMAGAIGRMHDIVIEAATPELIGREIIWVRTTREALERFPKATKGKAYVMSEAGTVYAVPEKYSFVDVKTDIVIRKAARWTEEFLEDATWNVAQRQIADIGKAIGELETEKVLALYAGISASNLATGAELDGGATAMDWAKVVQLWDAVRSENRKPTVLVLNPRQVSQLWKDDKFIHGFYFGDEADVRRGVLGSTYLGMRIVSSTLVPNGTAYAIDTNVAAVMLVRRDVVIKEFEDPEKGEYGVVGSERIGLGVLDSKGVARMTNIATAL